MRTEERKLRRILDRAEHAIRNRHAASSQALLIRIEAARKHLDCTGEVGRAEEIFRGPVGAFYVAPH